MPLWLLQAAASAGTLAAWATGRDMPLTRMRLSKLVGDAWFSAEKLQREIGFEPEHHLEEEINIMAKSVSKDRTRYA